MCITLRKTVHYNWSSIRKTNVMRGKRKSIVRVLNLNKIVKNNMDPTFDAFPWLFPPLRERWTESRLRSRVARARSRSRRSRRWRTDSPIRPAPRWRRTRQHTIFTNVNVIVPKSYVSLTNSEYFIISWNGPAFWYKMNLFSSDIFVRVSDVSAAQRRRATSRSAKTTRKEPLKIYFLRL